MPVLERANPDALRSVYTGTLGWGILLGAVAGMATSVAVAVAYDTQSRLWTLAPEYAIPGAVAGFAAAGVALAALAASGAYSSTSRVRVAVMGAASTVVMALLSLWGFAVMRMPPVGALAVAAFVGAGMVGLALRAERRAPRREPPAPRDVSPGIPFVVVFGWIVSVPFALVFTLPFVRDQLHISCSYAAMGTEGRWVCADGIGYIGVAIVLGGFPAAAAVAAAIASWLVRKPVRTAGVLVLLSALTVAWPLAWTWHGVANLVGTVPDVARPEDFWALSALATAIVALVALAAAASGLLIRGRAAHVLLWCGAAGMGVATLVQPGLGVSFVGATAMLFAAGWRVADGG
jgi:hypothetical protein